MTLWLLPGAVGLTSVHHFGAYCVQKHRFAECWHAVYNVQGLHPHSLPNPSDATYKGGKTSSIPTDPRLSPRIHAILFFLLAHPWACARDAIGYPGMRSDAWACCARYVRALRGRAGTPFADSCTYIYSICKLEGDFKPILWSTYKAFLTGNTTLPYIHTRIPPFP